MTVTGVGQAEYLPWAFPRTAQWHEQRRNGIGGSEASTILGLNPWDSPLDLYRLKIGDVLPEDRPESEAMRWGRLLEGIVADVLEAALQDNVDNGLYLRAPEGTLRHPEHHWMLANVDRLVMHEESSSAVAIAEVKTVGLRGSADWAEPSDIATHALLQAVHYMAVTGLPRTYFGVLIAGQEFRWRTLDRDRALEDTLIEEESRFWECVQNHEPPRLPINDANPSLTKAALNRLWQTTDPETVADLDAEYAEFIEERKRLDAAIKAYTTDRDAIDNRLRDALRNREVGLIDGREVVTWKTQTRRALDQSALKAEQPDIAEKYMTTTSTRVLRVK